MSIIENKRAFPSSHSDPQQFESIRRKGDEMVKDAITTLHWMFTVWCPIIGSQFPLQCRRLDLSFVINYSNRKTININNINHITIIVISFGTRTCFRSNYEHLVSYQLVVVARLMLYNLLYAKLSCGISVSL